ncbi:fimbrillin family protein [Bacteroides cellulosilyticus]|uniref:fimbrillin family protein n=1 Tax=Bacteroides cellulosilyticus TaxID=246787 RepID=UPI00234E038D|nr:fimbrillin family protein [Bacteroides cellulosilyticus]MDC7176300.1 fimbrillin family protein [Bacteroides cellulosilyticus]MDC7179994.1 fimbrillin family protein [Bacteroides cellulosilyticus]
MKNRKGMNGQMRRLINYVGSSLWLLLTLAACQQEEWEDKRIEPNDGVLRFKGINAQQVQVSTRNTTMKGYFKENSHYRIWAYGDKTGEDNRTLRFNATGIETLVNGAHYITFPNVAGNEAKLSFENDKDVIDFYGLIDPAQQKQAIEDNYVDYVTSYLKPAENSEPPIYTVKLQNDTLPDLRYAVKKDCNQENVGFVIPLEFKHILSKVSFEIVQEEANGGNKYGDLHLEGIKVLNQSGSGTFNIKSGLFTGFAEEDKNDYAVNLPTQNDTADKSIPITTAPKEAGSILLFPMIEKVLTKENMLKVAVTLSGTKEVLEQFAESEEIEQENGKHLLTITCPIYANPGFTSNEDETQQEPLRLTSNYEYVLQFMIMNNDVRIITIVPRVYEWLDGENEQGNGYEEQDLGQPVTFNGVVWSDRNLGATSAHPLDNVEEWRKSVGYFYQFDRNIPYFTNTYTDGRVNLYTPLEEALHEEKAAEGENITNFGGKKRKLYPVVNYSAWELTVYPNEEQIQPVRGNSGKYISQIGVLPSGSEKPYWGVAVDAGSPGETDLWKKSVQPCPKGWRIPTREDFMGIMPGSDYAGNLTFRIYKTPTGGGWRPDNTEKEHDFAEDFKANGTGITTIAKPLTPMIREDGEKVAYFGAFPCLYREEQNDPLDGYKSCYILSMCEDDWVRALDGSKRLRKEDDFVYNWGVIYGIKNVGTAKAYRVKWEIKLVGKHTTIKNITSAAQYCTNSNTTQYEKVTGEKYDDGLYGVLVISRYPATQNDNFRPAANGSYEWVAKKKEWWSNPAETLYLPICGVGGKWNTGHLYNIGTEGWYGTSVSSSNDNNKKNMAWLKMAGSSNSNQGVFYCTESPKYDIVSLRCVRDN